jgi:RNA polymerase sigma-70 factor (ECF subfamily)
MTAAPLRASSARHGLRLARPDEQERLPSPRPQPGSSAAPATADAEAIRKLWQLHGPTLLRFALKLTLGDKQRAEDIVQETLLRAWRRPDVVGTGQLAIRPWLFTVTRHIAIDMWRARSHAEAIIDYQPADLPDLPDPADGIERAMTVVDVRAAIAQLRPEHRQVIVEGYYLGRSVAQIAQSLGIPEGTVKSRTYYAMRHLRHVLSAGSDTQDHDGALAATARRAA